jgi:hypothetical protein
MCRQCTAQRKQEPCRYCFCFWPTERIQIHSHHQQIVCYHGDPHTCEMQSAGDLPVRPAQIETLNIVHDIVSSIVYDIRYDDTDIVYDIGKLYRYYGVLCSGVVLCVYCAFDLPE